jgi:superfamily I DNA and RNA helicase
VMNVMDMQQEREARRMGDGHRVIHGVAGSERRPSIESRTARRPSRRWASMS